MRMHTRRVPALASAVLFFSISAFAQSAGTVCDVDIDGDIDQLDISAIFAARNTAASGPDDPRDSIPDGLITVNDAAVCVTRCTLQGCPVITPDPNTPPVASAGGDQTVTAGETVTLDGSASSDADGDALSFGWSFLSVPPGSTAVLSNPAAVMPTFVADVAGQYAAQLVVNDGEVDSAPDDVVVITEPGNTPPVADAGDDQTVLLGDTVQLDGSGSSDVDGDPLAFHWSLVAAPAGSAAVLSDTAAVNPTFVADLPGDYVVQLVVDDGQENSPPDTVTVTTANTPPVADAGLDQTVALAALVQLDGSGSSDADGDPLAFAWSLSAVPPGSTAALGNANTASPTFVADVAGTYVAQLIVNDGTADSAPDSVVVTTSNTRPVADAGPDQAVTAGDTVQLDGGGSSDADGDTLSFEWAITTAPAGSAAALDDPFAPAPAFVADVDGLYVVQLIVNDGGMDSAADTVTITAEAAPELPTVTVTAVDDLGSEVGPDPAAFTISRTGDTTDPLSVSYTMAGSATNGVDYAALSGSVTIAAGSASAAVVVAPLADALSEGTESVILSLAPDADYTVGTPGIAGAQITDNLIVTIVASDPDASELTLDPGSFTLSRAGGDLVDPLNVFLSRSGAANDPLFPDDTTAISGLATIPAGQASVVITATPLRDNLAEGAEDLTLTIAPNPAYVIGSPASATVTIADDPPIVTVIATVAQASEAGPVPGELTFNRSGGNLAAGLTVLCDFSGTAANNADYVFTSCDTTIPANQSSTSRTITPRADNRVEGSETVIATIGPSITSSYLIGTPSAATITIADDPAVVTLTATDPDAAEAGLDPGVFTVARSNGNLADDLVVVITRGGTAADTLDYDLFSQIVVIPANAASTEIVVNPIDDAVDEDAETVVVSVSPADRYDIAAPGTATVTIADNDP